MALNLSKIGWYWHRLWAMSPREVLLRVQKKSHQRADAHYRAKQLSSLAPTNAFPLLPTKSTAPAELLNALAADVEKILAGEWKAFGHLPMKISDPPKWHADNLVGIDLQSTKIAFKLDHRAQPGGADIKVIWEPNRWYQLVRLAMAAWLLDHAGARDKCVQWLHDWARQNPPYTGLNWTSGLETGIRLIQYTWIDAFLSAANAPEETLGALRQAILPPHCWYTWRYKSFGSSANNHLIGELAGLIVAHARWPQLAEISAPIGDIGSLMDREILAQFADDGGNKEQALAYHLFSWEFCFQAERALERSGHPLSTAAQERLLKAGEFYRDAKPAGDPWDFGDSDNAWVTPLFADETKAALEWWKWLNHQSPTLNYWWGNFGARQPSGARTRSTIGEWLVFPSSGCAVLRSADWILRFDFSSLGYLSMAPHGHLDALHLSVWFRRNAIIIDPGTGAYYADKAIRNYLAGWPAHNGPHLKKPPFTHPRRFGTFLWGEHHKVPTFHQDSPQSITATLDLPYGRAVRNVTFVPGENAVRIRDSFSPKSAPLPFVTLWKFAPELHIERTAPPHFKVGHLALHTGGWKMARTYNPPEELRRKIGATTAAFPNVPLDALVSPAFRAITVGSYLALESSEPGPLELTIGPG